MHMVDLVVQALLNLGGDALLEDLYEEVGRVRQFALRLNEEAYVRLLLQQHSEDSNIDPDRKLKPLFYSVGGLGSGHWGLIATRRKLESSFAA
jgi:hypothetical protein